MLFVQSVWQIGRLIGSDKLMAGQLLLNWGIQIAKCWVLPLKGSQNCYKKRYKKTETSKLPASSRKIKLHSAFPRKTPRSISSLFSPTYPPTSSPYQQLSINSNYSPDKWWPLNWIVWGALTSLRVIEIHLDKWIYCYGQTTEERTRSTQALVHSTTSLRAIE